MSSCDIESQQNARNGSILPSSISRKWKIVISTAILVGALVAIGVCATAVGLGVSGTRNDRRSGEETASEEVKRSFVENGAEVNLVRNRRFPTNAKPANFRISACFSDETNETFPAAHIKGKGFQWKKNGAVYEPRWDCRGTPAFVTGGMWFNQTTKSLYVPVCGWYSVSSVIAFQNNGNTAQAYSYNLQIDRNCSGNSHNYNKRGNMVNAPVSGMSQSLSSVVVNDVVKICRGGRIYVHIPADENACCPRGYSEVTSISAHLIRESDCEWPIPEHNQPREPYQN